MRFVPVRLAAAAILFLTAAWTPAFATVFSALPDAEKEGWEQLKELLKKDEEGIQSAGKTIIDISTSFGAARLDPSRNPPRIAVGEIKSIWKGLWKVGGAKLSINRAVASAFVYDGNSEKLAFGAAWVAGNEAVAVKAKHKFRLKVYRKNPDGSETLVTAADKEVTVDAKGLGGTKFKNGGMTTGEITVSSPAQFIVVLEAECVTSNDVLQAKTSARFLKK